MIEYYGKREIRIRISGGSKRDFMTIITHELDKIHDSYNRLKYNKMIPCNCRECKSSQNPHFYAFETLRRFRENGQPIQCQNSFEMVNVSGLMDDVFGRDRDYGKDEKVPDVIVNITNIGGDVSGSTMATGNRNVIKQG
ncbi:MAG: hypothetical protein HC887_09940 [Desulfobacteraceae bacterium]|nr:hypothetical protein [Desulfobacteraceae bacterium]